MIENVIIFRFFIYIGIYWFINISYYLPIYIYFKSYFNKIRYNYDIGHK